MAKHGWVFVTKDGNIRRRPLELEALRASKLRVVIITGGNLTGDELAALMVRAFSRIDRYCRRVAAPAIIRVTRSGAVDVLEDDFRSKRR